jgi:3-oxoacyl-(acyl-carrier-protein) synthase
VKLSYGTFVRCTTTHAITGGTGALGVLTARWLGDKGVRRLLLVSRSGVRASGTQADWESLRATNVDVEICLGDVVDVCAIIQAASQILHGAWHTAGVLADATVLQQTASRLRIAFAPKAEGAMSLHRLHHTQPALDAFVMFSSIAALIYSKGQANYAAANSVLDAVASWRTELVLTAASVQFGPWADVGMAAAGNIAKRMRAQGVGLIKPTEGLMAMELVAQPGGPSVLLMAPVKMNRLVATSVPTFLSGLASEALDGLASTLEETSQRPVELDAVLSVVRRTVGSSPDADVPLMEAGLDSLGAVELRNVLQQAAGEGRTLPSTFVFDYPTARQIAAHLSPASAKPSASGGNAARQQCASRAAALTIGGLSSSLPMGARGQTCWRSMCWLDAAGEMPTWRFEIKLPSTTPSDVRERVRYASLLGDDVELFDNGLFGISAIEAATLEGVQRLLLEHGYAAFHSAGLGKSMLHGEGIGVFAGLWAFDSYAEMLRTGSTAYSGYTVTSASMSVVVGRLSFVLDLHGPCSSFDTACSSSLVSSHFGIRALWDGECLSMLLAGASMIFSPMATVSIAMAGMTSIHGRCFTFDDRASGYARSEACVAAYTSQIGVTPAIAVHCGCRVLGSAIRAHGKSASLTAPNSPAQQELLAASMADAGVSADMLHCVEAHGTGTALGDPIEVAALASTVFRVRGARESVVLGGSKANFGHAEPAAGAAGTLMLISAIRTRQAPPNAQLCALNKHVSSVLPGAKVMLSAQMVGLSLMAATGVSSFGYAGTISHVVLHHPSTLGEGASLLSMLVHKHHTFPLCKPPHPFVQDHERATDGAIIFHSYVAGSVQALVANHVVQGRVIFPGAGFLEMARAVACIIDNGPGTFQMLDNIFFLQPLEVLAPGVHVECVFADYRFQVRTMVAQAEMLHCSGMITPDAAEDWDPFDRPSTRGGACMHAADINALYNQFDASGLQYGPHYRTLTQAWKGGAAAARLAARSAFHYTQVHPADLDDALCMSALTSSSAGKSGKVVLPFAVDDARMMSTPRELWAVRDMFPRDMYRTVCVLDNRFCAVRRLWSVRRMRQCLCSSERAMKCTCSLPDSNRGSRGWRPRLNVICMQLNGARSTLWRKRLVQRF